MLLREGTGLLNRKSTMKKDNSLSQKKQKTVETFATFCKDHKIATDAIRWRIIGDKRVKISVNKIDLKDGGWGLMSVGLMFALRELGVSLDVTIREDNKDVEIIVEK